MLRDYVKRTRPRADSADRDAAGQPATNPMRELQAQYAKILTRCYEIYAEGKRCIHEDDPTMQLNCSKCKYRDEGPFCKANVFLKRVVSLVAEHLANLRIERGALPQQEPGHSTASNVAEPLPPLTQHQVAEFKAQGAAYEIKTPLCDEPVWLVPERTGQDRLEFTPEEIHFMVQAAATLEGTLIEIARSADAQPERSEA